MAAQNPAGPSAYAVSPTINPTTGAMVVDPADLITPTLPTPDYVPPIYSAGGYQPQATQTQIAILAELRVISTLLVMNSANNLDLVSLRADEAVGVSGGALQ